MGSKHHLRVVHFYYKLIIFFLLVATIFVCGWRDQWMLKEVSYSKQNKHYTSFYGLQFIYDWIFC